MDYKETNVKVELSIRAELNVPVTTKSTYDYDDEIDEEIDRIFYKFVERPQLMETEDLKFINLDDVEIKDIN